MRSQNSAEAVVGAKKNIVDPAGNFRPDLSLCKFYFDFDNTATTFDVLDEIISRFAVSDEWKVLEALWKAGEISSLQCLDGQIRLIRIDRKTLESYLSSIKLDPYFVKLVTLLRREGTPPLVLSDGFSSIIHFILKRNGLRMRVFANRLKISKQGWIPSFPYQSPDCPRCAHCKKQHLLRHREKINIYIGDGRSDICPSEAADIVFAKASLLEHRTETKQRCIAFENLNRVYHTIKGWVDDQNSQEF